MMMPPMMRYPHPSPSSSGGGGSYVIIFVVVLGVGVLAGILFLVYRASTDKGTDKTLKVGGNLADVIESTEDARQAIADASQDMEAAERARQESIQADKERQKVEDELRKREEELAAARLEEDRRANTAAIAEEERQAQLRRAEEERKYQEQRAAEERQRQAALPPEPRLISIGKGNIHWHGMWKDSESNRNLPILALRNVQSYAADDNNKEALDKAALWAAVLGYRVFGIEAGREVWFGNDLVGAKRNGHADNTGEWRYKGGNWIMSLYSIPDPTFGNLTSGMRTSAVLAGGWPPTGARPVAYVGCYRDERNDGRVMNRDKIGSWNNMNSCALSADMRGRKYFGIENGEDCYVRDDDNLQMITRNGNYNDCTQRDAEGNGMGAPWRISLYQFLDQ